MKSQLTKKQVKTVEKLDVQECKASARRVDLIVNLRYDDCCGNGHNTFSLTVDTYAAGRRSNQAHLGAGCQHGLVEQHFPELAHLIKWHLSSSDGPMHYIANTVYHASDKDYNGLRKGEEQQIINGRTKKPIWQCVALDSKGEAHEVSGVRWQDSHEKPLDDEALTWVPVTRIGEGKEPDLEAARSCAAWPEATLEQLQDKELLEARLPELLAGFKTAMESIGFTY